MEKCTRANATARGGALKTLMRVSSRRTWQCAEMH